MPHDGAPMIDGVDYSQRFFEDVDPGEELPRVEDVVTYRRVIMNPATTWDYFPGHHDPEYARAQGQPTIYVNTMHFLGFIDRCLTEWAGPRSFLVRRKVSTLMSIYAGDTMVGSGRVVGTRREERAGQVRHLVDLEFEVGNQLGQRCASVVATMALPSREAGEQSPLWG
jgi:acyl dehydratase